MPSSYATKAALRRSMEPSVVLPEGLAELPSLGYSIFNDRGWRNSFLNYDYVRTEWIAYRINPGGSSVLAMVRQLEDSTFDVTSDGSYARVSDPQAAFELAAGWAMAMLDE